MYPLSLELSNSTCAPGTCCAWETYGSHNTYACFAFGAADRNWLRTARAPSASIHQAAGSLGRLKCARTTRARNSLGELGVSTRRALGSFRSCRLATADFWATM